MSSTKLPLEAQRRSAAWAAARILIAMADCRTLNVDAMAREAAEINRFVKTLRSLEAEGPRDSDRAPLRKSSPEPSLQSLPQASPQSSPEASPTSSPKSSPSRPLFLSSRQSSPSRPLFLSSPRSSPRSSSAPDFLPLVIVLAMSAAALLWQPVIYPAICWVLERLQ